MSKRLYSCVGNTALRLSTKQYRTLMELLTESAQKIANPDVSKHDVRRIIH